MTTLQIKETLTSFYLSKDNKIDSIVYAEIFLSDEDKYCANIITNVFHKDNGDIVFETKNITGLIAINPMSLEEIISEFKDLECNNFYILDRNLELQLVDHATTISSYELLDDNITKIEYKTFVFIA